MNKKIKVSKKDGRHVCEPTHTHVRAGDTVKWVSDWHDRDRILRRNPV